MLTQIGDRFPSNFIGDAPVVTGLNLGFTGLTGTNIGMLAANGESTLSNVYPISRGYENLHDRLKELGASVQA